MNSIAFFDLEINPKTSKLLDAGAVDQNGKEFHKQSVNELLAFIETSEFIVGHNIVTHDLKFLRAHTGNLTLGKHKVIDTLLLSPLLFPRNPYHKLVKDDKLKTEDISNPLNDAKKSRDLFFYLVDVFKNHDELLQIILYGLLKDKEGFEAFFRYCGCQTEIKHHELIEQIRNRFESSICKHCDLENLCSEFSEPLAYALALIDCKDRYSITPPWVLKKHPEVERILRLLRSERCISGCDYCNEFLDPVKALARFFAPYTAFRKFANEPLQEKAVNAAIKRKSLLALFPTGGGKSLTFQVPALMDGENAKALTVVISPLQSLMKDQVDNLEKKQITDAVTINGLLDPIERSKAIERVENGSAFILYIAPESLRSVTIERLLLKRKISRFVIDEAHCFSSWGQDFRVDYLYIGDFIKNLQEKKNLEYGIPVSCFTATAKRKVVEDIRAYFKDKLNLDLEVFQANTSRTNLQYRVYHKDNEEEKYTQLRGLIEEKDCPTIVYVSRTKRAYELAKRLKQDGFNARPYHGKMDKDEKTQNQNAFMEGQVNIMVATSAFGMGVDKDNVEKVIHYDISDSLEAYVQEAGRAGRNESIIAECYVLFNEEDLDKHFILLNQTKISVKEINQIWKGIKMLTGTRTKVSNSALEIARKAGWDENLRDIETKVTTAIAALEDAGYLKRGQNSPKIFASSILSQNAQEAIDKINCSPRFTDHQKITATRIIKKLFSSKSKQLSTDEVAEARVDYISDQLGIVREEVIRVIELLKEDKILADTKDLTANIKKSDNKNKTAVITSAFTELESRLLNYLNSEAGVYNLKDLHEQLIAGGLSNTSIQKLRTILNFWTIRNWIKKQNKEGSKNHFGLELTISRQDFEKKLGKKKRCCQFIAEYLYDKSRKLKSEEDPDTIPVYFSIVELKEQITAKSGLFSETFTLDDVEDSLFFLSRIDALKIEGGFLVVYNRLSLQRIETNNRIQYKESDYAKLKQFYEQKVQQIHIVGEYAKKMIKNYQEALFFVDDYFTLNYLSFLSKYFPGSRKDEINRTLTPEKFMRLFGELSPNQLEVIKDSDHQHILVAAGPGSGKTRLLVHKLASLVLAEDVKHEQLLMLAFSRAAVNEFKIRLRDLIGNAVHYIEIKTFHSYCFDLLGRIGTIEQSEQVVRSAVEKINLGEIELSQITKTVVVVDEAQDINADEFSLIQALMNKNDDMRVVFVGDDDQNIYEFRGADSRYMKRLKSMANGIKYELTENYRSKSDIVDLANNWVKTIPNRLKSTPGIPIDQSSGNIQIKHYTASKNLVVPIVTQIKTSSLGGNTCVLTCTNDEAAQVVGLLHKENISAKLIQSTDGFKIYDILEVRKFWNYCSPDANNPNISDEDWTDGFERLEREFKSSNKLELVLAIKQTFENVHNKKKYKSDWKAFLNESKMEDFVGNSSETILVSTIHKAKGKEFDNVFLLLNEFDDSEAERKRQFYVAITRCKANLFLHTNKDFFSQLLPKTSRIETDATQYPEPDQVMIYLTHKDVHLGYFENVQGIIVKLLSGDKLSIEENGLSYNGSTVVKYSKKFTDVLDKKRNNGYKVTSASVNFIVFWKGKDMEQELRVLLPLLTLTNHINIKK